MVTAGALGGRRSERCRILAHVPGPASVLLACAGHTSPSCFSTAHLWGDDASAGVGMILDSHSRSGGKQSLPVRP